MMILAKIQFPSFSAPQPLMISLLRYVKVPIFPPVPFIGVIRVNSVCSWSHTWLTKHELFMSSSVEEWLVCKCFLVTHDLVRNVHVWCIVWRFLSNWRIWGSATVVWTFLWISDIFLGWGRSRTLLRLGLIHSWFWIRKSFRWLDRFINTFMIWIWNLFCILEFFISILLRCSFCLRLFFHSNSWKRRRFWPCFRWSRFSG